MAICSHSAVRKKGEKRTATTRVFRKIKFVTNQLGELTMAVDIDHKPPKKD